MKSKLWNFISFIIFFGIMIVVFITIKNGCSSFAGSIKEDQIRIEEMKNKIFTESKIIYSNKTLMCDHPSKILFKETYNIDGISHEYLRVFSYNSQSPIYSITHYPECKYCKLKNKMEKENDNK